MASQAEAATITGLFNTGTDGSNVALLGGNGLNDPHYAIFSSTSPGFAGNQAVTYKHPFYAPDDADSRWISLSNTGSPGSNTTVYRLVFSLAGLNAATAQISGSFGADNIGTILLNGANTGISTASFFSLSGFNISSGFVAGLNTLDFSVVDQGAPTALRVDNLAGTADLAAIGGVPEPATWAMMLLGFFGLGGVLRNRRRQSFSFS